MAYALTAEQKEVIDRMDAAGEAAAAKLKADMMTKPEIMKAVKIVGGWMAANYATAGYKRLSKTLIALSKLS